MPSGLQTPSQVTAIVGNDVQLTCRASKYIYTHLTWSYPSSEPAAGSSVVRKMDKYSISLTLLIPNVTKEQSGLYRCRAQNQHNSTDTLEQQSLLLVRGTGQGTGGLGQTSHRPCVLLWLHFVMYSLWIDSLTGRTLTQPLLGLDKIFEITLR